MISDCITKPIAIEGHPTRGKEVIELLEMIGGNNVHNLSGNNSYAYYFIEGCQNEIRAGEYIFGDENMHFFTLEEFLEKYPFKIGDYVTVQGWRSPGFILRMHIKNFQIVYDVGFIDEGPGIAADVCVECIKHYCKETQTNKNAIAIHITNNINLKNQDKVEIKLGDDWEIKEENGKTYAVRKKIKITEDQLLDIGFSKCRKLSSKDPDYVYTGIGDFYALDMFLWINPDENFCSIRYNDFTVYPYETKECIVYNIDTIKDIIDLQYSCLTKYKEVANKFNPKISILELIKNEK